MGIRISNYEENPDLADAIKRYHILLRMSFETNLFKIFETVGSQILKYQVPAQKTPVMDRCEVDWVCANCKAHTKLQLNFGADGPIQAGFVPFPKDNKLICPSCGTESDLTVLRMQIESQTKKKIT